MKLNKQHIVSLLTLILTVIILLVYMIRTSNPENFLPAFSVVVDEKRDKLTIHIDKHVSNNKSLSLVNASKNIILQGKGSKQNALTASDAFSTLYNRQTDVHLVGAFENNVCSLVIISLITSTKQWDKDVYVIGVSDKNQQILLGIILTCMKNPHKIVIKQVPQPDQLDPNFFTENGVDAMSFFQCLDTIKILNTMKIQVIDYADSINMTQLAVVIPYALKTTHDLSLIFPQLKGKRSVIKSVISFDVLIVGDISLFDSNVEDDVVLLLTHLNSPTKINYYAMFLPTFDISQQYARNFNSYIGNRGNLQILEQFQQPLLPRAVSTSNVKGFYDHDAGYFHLHGRHVQNIELIDGMMVILTSQDRDYENGTYRVESINKETSLLRRKSQPQEQNSTHSYICYGDTSIQSKALCESSFDEQGFRKRKPTVWDRPCKSDIECPFFQANKNYNNYRGGCIDGQCEMPIGVKALSFQKYDVTSKPFCYNCVNSPFCCEQQKNKTLYPHLKSPDYAFELDFFERQKTYSTQ